MTLSAAGARHIVFVSLVFHPDSSASSILFTDLFRRLASERTRVTALCGFPTKDSAEQTGQLPRRDRIDSVEIIRCGLRLEGKRTLVTRAATYASFLAHAGWILLRIGRRATVAGGTDPPFTPIALWLLSLLGRFQYDCILLDLYPDGLIGLGTLKSDSLIVRVWRFLNRLSFARARRIVVIGRDMATRLCTVYGVDPSKIIYVPHWGSDEMDRATVDEEKPLLRELGLEKEFVVQYSGNMGLWHDMDSLVRAADRLRGDSDIHFLFIGKGRRRQAAVRLSGELGLTNVTWVDFAPRERLTATLSSCDVSLISLRAGLEGVAVPSKLYGILAAGRPVIAQVPQGSEVARVVQEEQCGIVVPPGDVEGLARAVRALREDDELRRRMGARARNAYRTKYTVERAVTAFQSLWHLS